MHVRRSLAPPLKRFLSSFPCTNKALCSDEPARGCFYGSRGVLSRVTLSASTT